MVSPGLGLDNLPTSRSDYHKRWVHSEEEDMTVTTHRTEHKSFAKPEEGRDFPNGRAEMLTLGGSEVGRLVLEPGWRWSNDVKPIAKTASCEAPHSSTTSAGGWRSAWTTAPSSWPARETSRRCPAVTTPG